VGAVPEGADVPSLVSLTLCRLVLCGSLVLHSFGLRVGPAACVAFSSSGPSEPARRELRHGRRWRAGSPGNGSSTRTSWWPDSRCTDASRCTRRPERALRRNASSVQAALEHHRSSLEGQRASSPRRTGWRRRARDRRRREHGPTVVRPHPRNRRPQGEGPDAEGTSAGRFEVVNQLARELEARRLER
jgi:hypothetical protein